MDNDDLMDERIDALFKKAQKYLRSAAVLLELEDFDSTASRSYFAMFFAAQAALLQEMNEMPLKQSIRAAFVERFVEDGPLPTRAAEVLHRGSELQELGDFAHDFAVSSDDAEFILAEAEAFVNSLEKLVASTI